MSKAILITGCSSGIGYDAAVTLHARGWRVFATCRQQTDCERLAQQGLESFRLDYTDETSIRSAVAEVENRTGGKLDALFNNGAYALPGAVEDVPRGGLRAIFETNVFGPFDLMNRLLPQLLNTADPRVVNCSSVLGFAAIPFRGAYSATKAAMESLTDTARRENRKGPIKFILIEPGPISTRIRENAIPHFEKWIDWEASRKRNFYEKTFRPRLYRTDNKKDRFELAPAAVTAKLIHALEARRPKPRYFVTVPTHFAG
ncbi:MAG: SDR family NAD(P)-dependent oxidoreductase, partial [Gammaproteobacteria bacterium]|nr:SDR family NAD(P)-dependent oxidoreductase [Gammaproteobacteria bacterium]